jgi:hypothetical protein
MFKNCLDSHQFCFMSYRYFQSFMGFYLIQRYRETLGDMELTAVSVFSLKQWIRALLLIVTELCSMVAMPGHTTPWLDHTDHALAGLI